MFLETLIRRNNRFIQGIAQLHQKGELPANTYALDIKNINKNAEMIANKGKELGLDVIAMMKQIGRNPDASKAIVDAGIKDAVAVDYECAYFSSKNGLNIGHIGHLVQIPYAFFQPAFLLAPKLWTLFSIDHAKSLSKLAKANNRIQNVSLRVWDDESKFYHGHEGGFHLSELDNIVATLGKLDNLRIAGVTSFPALLFSKSKEKLEITPNAFAIMKAAQLIEKRLGYSVVRNMPGTTSIKGIEMLAEIGATQVEPGHGLTGTTPLSYFEDTPEIPSVAYVSEISHIHNDKIYVVGGGLYQDPVLGEMPSNAIVIDHEGHQELFQADMPKPGAIDYYAILEPNKPKALPKIGSTVIFGFRPQVFVTRAFTAGIYLDEKHPTTGKLYSSNGEESAMKVTTK